MQVQSEVRANTAAPHVQIKGLQMVDAGLGVVSIEAEDVPEWVKDQFLTDTPYDNINSLTFFYLQGADLVVLNRSHRDADIYELLVTAYLEADEGRRKELKERVPVDVIGSAIRLLDFIIEKRKSAGQ